MPGRRGLPEALDGEKTVFLSHLCIKCIILPRQARDTQRENSKTYRFVAQSGFLPASLHCLQETKGHTYVDEGKQTYIVPDNVQAVNIWMSAGGGGLGSQAHPRSTGGAAGFSWATFRVQPEWRNSDGKIELKVYVGCAGESAGVGVQGVGGGGGGGSAVLDLQGNVLVVAGGAGGQAGAWDASRQADGEMSSTHGGHGGGPQGGDGGTTPCNGGAAGGGGGGQSLAGTAGGSNRGYDPGMPGKRKRSSVLRCHFYADSRIFAKTGSGQPWRKTHKRVRFLAGHGRNGGDGGGFTASCHPVDESTNSPMAWTDDAYEEACDDLLVRKTLPDLETFVSYYSQKVHFAKTGSGQAQRKLRGKKGRFSVCRAARTCRLPRRLGRSALWARPAAGCRQ
jgi:hypothetical protein